MGERARAGDEAAWSLLYEWIESKVRQLTGGKLPEVELQEVVQDTVMKLCRSIGRIDLEASFSAYLRTSISNNAVDRLRKINRRREVLDSDFNLRQCELSDGGSFLNELPDPGDAEEQHQIRLDLERTLEQLPERARRVYRRVEAGASDEEIRQDLGLTRDQLRHAKDLYRRKIRADLDLQPGRRRVQRADRKP